MPKSLKSYLGVEPWVLVDDLVPVGTLVNGGEPEGSVSFAIKRSVIVSFFTILIISIKNIMHTGIVQPPNRAPSAR